MGPALVGDALTLTTSEEPLGLRRGDQARLWLRAAQTFHLVKADEGGRHRAWKVATDSYAYTVSDDETLATELVAWHWHPASRLDPHLHVGRSHPDFGFWAHLHIPTGRVAFEDVMTFVLADLGVQPERDDWETVLADARAKFTSRRSWA